MHDQAEGPLGAQLPCPFDDELLGARVEIALPERGGVHRIEQLLHLGNVHVERLSLR
jgi:hypothetical protein